MVDTQTPLEALNDALYLAGSQAALARICSVSATAVWKWLQSSKRLPAEYVLRVEAATGVSRHDLRPDIYPRDALALPASVMGEETPLCGPILSTRARGGQGKAQAGLDREAAA